MRFSKTTGCFYPENIDYTNLPADLIDATPEDAAAAMARPPGATLDVVAGRVVIIPQAPKPLADVKAEKLAELQLARDAAEVADVTVHGKVFSADPAIADKFEKLASRLRRGKPTKLEAIFTVDGTPVSTVTAALLEQIEDAIAANGEAAWNRYGQLVGQVMAATTVDQINMITW